MDIHHSSKWNNCLIYSSGGESGVGKMIEYIGGYSRANTRQIQMRTLPFVALTPFTRIYYSVNI